MKDALIDWVIHTHYSYMCLLIDWLLDLLINGLIDWLVDKLIDWGSVWRILPPWSSPRISQGLDLTGLNISRLVSNILSLFSLVSFIYCMPIFFSVPSSVFYLSSFDSCLLFPLLFSGLLTILMFLKMRNAFYILQGEKDRNAAHAYMVSKPSAKLSYVIQVI